MNYHKKIAPKREGPFEIMKVIGPVTYQLKLPETWKIHNVFHAALLQQYKETEIYGANYPRPPPELVEGEEVYEVETSKTRKGLPILRVMERLPHRRSILGTRRGIFRRRQPPQLVQELSSAMNQLTELAVITSA